MRVLNSEGLELVTSGSQRERERESVTSGKKTIRNQLPIKIKDCWKSVTSESQSMQAVNDKQWKSNAKERQWPSEEAKWSGKFSRSIA